MMLTLLRKLLDKVSVIDPPGGWTYLLTSRPISDPLPNICQSSAAVIFGSREVRNRVKIVLSEPFTLHSPRSPTCSMFNNRIIPWFDPRLEEPHAVNIPMKWPHLSVPRRRVWIYIVEYRQLFFRLQGALPNMKWQSNKIIQDECSTSDQTIFLGLQIFLEHRSSRPIDQQLWWPPCPALR